MNNADLIVATVKAAGIKHGFGIPSGNVIPLMEAMRSGGVEFILTAHEGSAGFAADVFARMTGVPGLAIATLGPGATNLATGVGNAYLDRLPMIAITCNLYTHQLGRRIQMGIDHQALFKPITKGSWVLRRGEVARTLQSALQLALSEPPGPVHLDLPEDVALAPATESVPELLPAIALPRATDSTLRQAAELLEQAQRPVAVLGASAMRMAQPSLLRRFVEKYSMPFASTTMAKGLIEETHPLSIGCIERAERQRQRQFLQGCDLVVGLGYDTIEVEYEAWLGHVPLLHMDIEGVDADDSVKIAHQIIGDLQANLTRLLPLGISNTAWSSHEVCWHRDSFQEALRPQVTKFSPHQAIDVVRDILPQDGILAFDVGAHTHQIASQWTVHQPRTFLITNGWSSMGFGLPAAISAKLAAPDKAVVCLLGDGCFQMTCGELASAKRAGLTLPVVVLNDGWLSLIKVKQERRQIAHYGTELQSAYEAPPAHYFGVPVIEVHDTPTLRAALQQALATSGPTVIEVVVDAEQYSLTVFD